MRPATLVRLRLATLAAAAFVYVTSETFPVAVLPQLGAGLGVGDAAVGRLVTLYAVVVAVTAVKPAGDWTGDAAWLPNLTDPSSVMAVIGL